MEIVPTGGLSRSAVAELSLSDPAGTRVECTRSPTAFNASPSGAEVPPQWMPSHPTEADSDRTRYELCQEGGGEEEPER